MRVFLTAAAAAVVTASCCSGIIVPKPDLAQALKAADTVVVARVISGKAQSSTAGASANIVLRVVRVLQGEITAGSEIAVKTQGNRLYIPGPASNLPRSWVVEPFTALWFLRREGGPYIVTPVTAGAGEPERAGLEFPEDASPPTSQSNDLRRTIAEEIVGTLRAMATKHPKEIKPVYNVQVINGTVDRSYIFGRYAGKALGLMEALPTLRDKGTLVTIHRELASDPAGYLRAIGIAGLIGAGDPAGPKQAAAEIRSLCNDAYLSPIAMSLMGYREADDPEAIRAIGQIATENGDLNMPMLQQAAAEALNAIHTKDAMPALIRLLDSDNPRVGGLALNGICLFVRNSPVVLPQMIPSGSWRVSREPAPFRTKDTEAYCWGNPLPASSAPPEYQAFWKNWWREHETEVMR